MYTAPYPPPNDVYLVEANSTQLSFQWRQISARCPAVQYRIVASNCGQCPNITPNTTATCTGPFPLNDVQCLFALQTIVCDDIVGNVSMAVSVTMRGMHTLFHKFINQIECYFALYHEYL